MLERWRILFFWALVLIVALWIQWWGSSGFPLKGEICETMNPKYDCESYNVIVYSAWRFAKAVDHWSALIGAIATIAIAAFTWTLWQSSEKMWGATKESADAAKLNAEALIDADRAHLHAVIKVNNLASALRPAAATARVDDDAMVNPRPYLEFALKNLGRSAAIMEETGWYLVQREPGHRVWQYPVGAIVNPVIDGGAETHPSTPCVFESAFRVSDAKDAFSGHRPLYFVGYVVYTTSLDRVYEFRWQYENSGTSWLLTYYNEWERGKQTI
jgi:hypothetical protein